MDRRETAALLRRARAGSDDALREVHERYAARLLSLIRLRMGRKLRSVMESRDLLQNCLVKSLERIEQFEASDSASWMAWLARIAENEIRDQFEYHKRLRRDVDANVALDRVGEPLVERVRSALSHVVLDERLRRLEAALEELPENQREVIVLRKLEERSWSEIGERMGTSADAARMLMARAMAALTRRMGPAA